MRNRSAVVAAAAATVLTLAACSGGSGSGQTTRDDSPRARLATAKKILDDTPGVHLTLTSKGVPDGVNGVLGAEGDGAHPPAFTGTLKARLKGLEANVPVTAVDAGVWVKLPFGGSYSKQDPAKFNAPDPADLFSKDHGVTSLLTATKKPELGDTSRDGKEVVQQINGTLPGKTVTDVLVIGDKKSTYDVTYELTKDKGQLRTVTLSGPFFAGGRSTYTLRLDDYGKHVDVAKP